MIPIIWTGKGFLVAVFVLGFSLAANLICNSVTGDKAYWDAHKWPFAVSLFAAAAACWIVGRFLQFAKAQVLRDLRTGKVVVLQRSHTFFWIPMTWWGLILAVLGLIALGMEFTR